jgi:hypothetical protein
MQLFILTDDKSMLITEKIAVYTYLGIHENNFSWKRDFGRTKDSD